MKREGCLISKQPKTLYPQSNLTAPKLVHTKISFYFLSRQKEDSFSTQGEDSQQQNTTKLNQNPFFSLSLSGLISTLKCLLLIERFVVVLFCLLGVYG